MSTHYPKLAAAEVIHRVFHYQRISITIMHLQTVRCRNKAKPPSILCAGEKDVQQSMLIKLLPVVTTSLKQFAVSLALDEAEQEQMQYKKCRHPVRYDTMQAVLVSKEDGLPKLGTAYQTKRISDKSCEKKIELEVQQGLVQEVAATRLKKTLRVERLTKLKNSHVQDNEELHMDWCNWPYT